MSAATPTVEVDPAEVDRRIEPAPNHPPGGPAGVPESPENERHPMDDRPA